MNGKTAKTPNPVEAELRRELRKIHAKTLLLRASSGALKFVALAAWVFMLVVLWTALRDAPPLGATLAVSRIAVALIVLLFVICVIYPIAKTPRLRKLAFELENRKDFQDLVAAGYEFSRDKDAAARYSPSLIREVIRRAVGSVKGLEVRFLFVDRRHLVFVPLAYGAMVILTIIALASPGTLLDSLKRITAPRESAAVEHEANLFCSPGDITVLSGSDVEVIVRDFGGSQEPVTLTYNLSTEFWKTEPTEAKNASGDGAVAGDDMADDTAGDEHVYMFRDLRGTVSYYFERGDQRTPSYTITVVNKPVVMDLGLVLTPPAYTGEAPDTLLDSGGNVHVLEGTHVAVEGRSNNILESAWTRFDDKTKQPIEVAGRSFEFDFRALRDGTYSILLRDSLGHETDDPLLYTVEVFEDNPPLLDVLEPGNDATMPRSLRVDVGFMAADDYGVNEAAIYFRKGGFETYEKGPIPLGPDIGKREFVKGFIWSLEQIDLFPGDYIEYFIEVKDNNIVTGPGVTRSRVYTISVPTMGELYDQVAEESTKQTNLFEEALKEGHELKERVEKLAREMKKSDEIDWTQQKEIDKAIESQELIQEKLDEIQQSLDETLESLSENQMTSQEIGEKLEEINRLIEEINDEALNKYIEEMRKAMEQLDPEQVQQAMENLNMSAEDLLKSLERTESLLKEIQREQAMEEMVRKTRDLMEAQENLNEMTEQADDQETMDGLADEQEKLADKASELEEDLGDLSDVLDDQTLADEVEEASEKFSMSQTSKEMQAASSQLQKGQKSQAESHQEKATNNLIGLFGKMAAMQAEMQAASSQRTAANLQRLAGSTLELSFKQERLTQRLRDQIAAQDTRDLRSPARELAVEQQTYTKAVQQIADELSDLANETIMIPERLIKSLGQCIESMEKSLLFLEQNKPFMSTTTSTEATTQLNEITMGLLSACSQCSQGGSGGQPQASPMMQQLLNGQQQVLKETEQLLATRAAQEKLRQQMQAEVGRVAGEQRSLKDIAEKIQKDMKDNERVLGRMDKIVEEMEEVIRDFEGGGLDDQTLRRQERILSRLLDADRSIHSRDYEKKRQSETAQDVFSDTPGMLHARPTAKMLREEIRRAMTLKAPGEFEDLIRMYFRALAEEAPVPSERGGM
jgi:hypothetical protein